MFFKIIMLVNAANLDGGSSSEIVYNGKIMNRLWNIFGERYIPTAFVVYPLTPVSAIRKGDIKFEEKTAYPIGLDLSFTPRAIWRVLSFGITKCKQ